MPNRYFYIFPLFIVVCSCPAMAQDVYSIKKEIEKIDSLLVYNQFDLAENKVDSLYLLFNIFAKGKYVI